MERLNGKVGICRLQLEARLMADSTQESLRLVSKQRELRGTSLIRTNIVVARYDGESRFAR